MTHLNGGAARSMTLCSALTAMHGCAGTPFFLGQAAGLLQPPSAVSIACIWGHAWSSNNKQQPPPLLVGLLGSCRPHFDLRLHECASAMVHTSVGGPPGSCPASSALIWECTWSSWALRSVHRCLACATVPEQRGLLSGCKM